MRQTAFIETSAINWFYDAGFDANKTNVLFDSQNLIPVVGMDTIYELARCFTVKPERAKALFCFLKELNPNYSCQREQLYIQEINSLREAKAVGAFLGYYTDEALTERMEQYSTGIFNRAHVEFIAGRQFFWDDCREKLWSSSGIQSKKGLLFTDYLSHCMEQLRSNVSIFQQWIKELTKKTLPKEDVINLFNKIENFPALRTSLYSQFYLNFLIIKNGTTPREDRFTDSLQVIVASYFSIIITNDIYIVDTLVPYLNPTQHAIRAPELHYICR